MSSRGDTAPGMRVTAWRPAVDGIEEVLHARTVNHAYPAHTHRVWTLLVVDHGTIGYALDGRPHDSTRRTVTLLPPDIPHDRRTIDAAGFHKRVLYLSGDLLPAGGAAVDTPALTDPLLRTRITQLHDVLRAPGDEFEAQSRLALVVTRLGEHLRRSVSPVDPPRDPTLARRLRDLLDEHLVTGLTLNEAAHRLNCDSTHLIRSFSREFGIPPHRYLVGRRVERARHLLLCGEAPVDVAVAAGFYDQAHLHRHFTRMLGTTPARFRGSRAGG